MQFTFRGASDHQLDDKGRLSVPAKFRSFLLPVCYITRGWHGCLFCFPWSEWLAIEERLSTIRISDMDGVAVQRFFCGGVEAQPDDQGRVLIPPHLRRETGIERDVHVRGTINRIEVWSRDAWQLYCESELSLEKMAEKAAALGL